MRYRIVKTAKSKLKPPIMIMTPWTYFDITTGFMVQADVFTTGQKEVISSEGDVGKVQPALFFQCLAVFQRPQSADSPNNEHTTTTAV